jgi:hypothetical protein
MLVLLRPQPVGERGAAGAAWPDDLSGRGRLAGFSPLEPRGQVGDVNRVEADGRAEADDAEHAAFDQPLDGARVHVEQVGGLARGQQRRSRCRHGRLGARIRRLRQGATRDDTAAPIWFRLFRARALPFAMLRIGLEQREREASPGLDAELETSVPQAPQQRVQALLDALKRRR